jgi:hypothetical protein
MWHEGTIGVPKGDGKYTVVHYWVKAYDEGSQYGIDGGRISKLTITVNGEITLNYDRGWDIEPEDEASQMVYAILLKEFN